MTNFNKRFDDYKTPQGLQVSLEEGEFIVVDGFEFKAMGQASMFGFLTNRRFILRQTFFNTGARNMGIFGADCVFIWLKDVEYISLHRALGFLPGHYTFRIKGTITDFSKEAKTETTQFIGHFSPGGFGHNIKSLYQRLTTQLAILGEEHDFKVLFYGTNAHLSTLEGQAKESIERGQRQRHGPAAAFYGIGTAFAIAWAVSLFAPEAPATRRQEMANQLVPQRERQVTQTPVEPTRQVTAQPPATIQNRTVSSTCWTTAFAGSDGSEVKGYDCEVRSLTTSAGLMIFVNWSDGVESQFVIKDDKTSIIYAGGSTVGTPAEWWESTDDGQEIIVVQSVKGAQTWININDALDANPVAY